MYSPTFVGYFPKKLKIHAFLVLLHFTLLCFTDVAFFYKLKARPSTNKKIPTGLFAILTLLQCSETKPTLSPRYTFTLSNLCINSWVLLSSFCQ